MYYGYDENDYDYADDGWCESDYEDRGMDLGYWEDGFPEDDQSGEWNTEDDFSSIFKF